MSSQICPRALSPRGSCDLSAKSRECCVVGTVSVHSTLCPGVFAVHVPLLCHAQPPYVAAVVDPNLSPAALHAGHAIMLNPQSRNAPEGLLTRGGTMWFSQGCTIGCTECNTTGTPVSPGSVPANPQPTLHALACPAPFNHPPSRGLLVAMRTR